MSIFDNPEIDSAIKQVQSEAQNNLREFDSQKKARYKVHPDKAAEFFADPDTNAYHADEAAQDWLKTYEVTSQSGNSNPKGLNSRLKLALQAHKRWSDERDIQPLSLSKEVRHDRRMENISSNLDNWSDLFSEDGFEREIERRGLSESYNELLDRGMDKAQVQSSLRRKLFTKDLAGKKDALSQARVSQHILGLEDQSDEAYLSGAQSWVEGNRQHREEMTGARRAAADDFFSRQVAVDWGLEAQKKISPAAADAYQKAKHGFKKQYGNILPVVRSLVDNAKAQGERGLFETTEEVDVNWGKIIELYGDNRRDEFLYVLGRVSEKESVNVEGFVTRNAKGVSRTVERMAKAGMRLIDQVKTEAAGVSNEALRDRQWNQFQSDIANLKENVATIEASNDFEKIANFTTASLPYMAFMATGVGTGLIAATEAQQMGERAREANPNLTYSEVMTVALPAGAVYAGIEKLQMGGLFGKFPGMQKVANKFTSGKSLGSWFRRIAATTAYEYGQETIQEAVEPLSRDIANQFKAEVPEGDWSTFEILSYDRLLGVIGLSALGGTGQWARARFTQQEVKSELQDKFSLRLTGATLEEANKISEMAEKDPDAALQEYKKTVFSKSVEERKEVSEAAIKESEDAVATGVLDGLPSVTSNDDGGFVVDFKDGTKKIVDSREAAQTVIDQRVEEDFVDAAQAVRDRMDNLLETSEGDNKAKIEKPRTFQELADLGVENVERLKEAVAVSYMQRGEAAPETIDLNNYTEQGSVTLRRKMAGFAVRLAKDKMTLPTTVDEEFSEGFLRMIVEQGETSFDEVKTMLDEFGSIAGIDMTQGSDVDPNRAVIEGFSKFAKAYMLQGDHKSIPESSQAWYRKAWRVLENPDSVPAPLRAFAELVTKLLRSVFDVAQAIRSQKQDGQGINPELEGLAMRALGLNEQQIAEEAQAKATKEIQEEFGIDPEADADPSFSIGNTTVTPSANTKTYPTKDGGVVGPASFSITAHHGTPHTVGRFSTENIGTGEGAQAYGWGLYFAESRGLAQQYRENLSNQSRFLPQWLLDGKSSTDAGIPDIIFLENIGVDGEIETEKKRLESRIRSAKKNSDLWTDADQVIKGAEEGLMWLEENQDAAERVSYEERKGSLYTVDLNVEQDELLDWDKPLSEQSELVRDTLLSLRKKMGDSFNTGREAYEAIATENYRKRGEGSDHAQHASLVLNLLGIKGIRYLDGDSRADGEGTSNYVIFNDADITIAEENGQVVDTSSPSFSIGNTTVTPNAETKTYPTKDGGVVGPASFSITAHHGTPHKVDKFSTENIGTGEGVQVYGWGLYFAETEAVAREYLKISPARRVDGSTGTPQAEAKKWLNRWGKDRALRHMGEQLDFSRARAANGWEGMAKEIAYAEAVIASLEKLEESDRESPNLYTVDLNVEQDELLDWDKPLSEQSGLVRKALKGFDFSESNMLQEMMAPMEANATTGRSIYTRMGMELTEQVSHPDLGPDPVKAHIGDKGASAALHAAGIKGIRYLDGGSRADGEGTSNYVIFDDADITITEENGQVVDTSSPSSSSTPAQDAEYLELAKNPEQNRSALQKLVDQAAKAAGYDSLKVYHGTGWLFDIFDFSKAGQNFRDGHEDGAFLTTSQKSAQNYADFHNKEGRDGRVVSAYVNTEDFANYDDVSWIMGFDADPLDEIKKERSIDWMDENLQDLSHLREEGFTGVDLSILKDVNGEGLIIPFNSNQIKSADPVTYDADGNVIPLSQRFDESRDEISFSITPKDEQMSEAVEQIFNGSSRFAEFSDKVRKRKEDILARYREQYAKADSESERAIIEVESLAQAEGLYMALPSRMKAIKSEIEEVAELIVERRSGVDSLKMKEDEGFRSVILPFKLPKAVSEFRVIKALRNNLTARGRLTREQHKIKMAAEATQLAELKEAEQVVARLRKQINKTVKDEIARDMLMRQAQEVATGDAKMDTLPKEIQPIVQEARDQVDRLSQKMIDSGIAKGDLAQVFERQMGNYLNRSYRRFTRPESWEKEVPQEARDAAKEYLRKELPADAYTPGLSQDEQLDGYVENLLKDSVSGSMMDSMTALLGQKHLGNLIGRKSIPKPIRDLWGEYKRLDENYLNSVRKMAGQVASHSILEDFKKDGLGNIIFEKPRKGHATQVTAEGNDALAPLDGYYVSEEMAKALEDFAEMGKKEIGTWLKWWLKFNSIAKVSKTIYNPTTHARNFFSNFGYVLANDNFFEYARSGKDSAIINFKEIFGFARTPEIENRIRYYVRLGIMHQGAVSQEFKDILKDFSAGEVDIEEYSQKKLLKIAKAPLDVIQAAYQAEDDFHKIVAFESEKRKLAKHKKNWSQEKIDREAAQIIRDTMPDYSQVPTAVKALRRVPLVGTFTSFTAEVLRNNHNIIARAVTEMKDPDLKVVGIRRMSFFMMAHAVPIALAAFLKEMFDVDDEEDEATRAIAAPWDKDSLLMYVGRSPSGDPKYANFSYTDPFSIFKTPFIISQREGLSATSITKGVMKGLEPFYGVEIGTKALMETANNKDDLGRDISNENDDFLTQAKDRSIHLLKALEPGFLRTGERIRRAYTGEKTPSGKEFDLATEIGAVITGQRVTTVRRQDAVKYRTWEFTDDKRDASTNFNKAWRNEKADRESLTEAIADYRRDTKLAFEGYQDVLKAVSVLGLSDEEILAAGYDNPKTPTAQIAQSLLDAKVGDTPIPQKKFSKSHLKEIREIEGREKLLRELIPEAF